ncbi:hypothetical protein BJ170DRAFT_38742 [Xylariales sp. AK1849]|nr:hypothetical protein BJ170DRAFT_38742 [Xylariales sp. AK1849]
MAGSDVEILVHITASTRASDDIRYRSLASAYLYFQPKQRRKLCETSDTYKGRSPTTNGTENHQAPSIERHVESQQSAIAENPLPSLKSPQASFESVLDNASSPLNLDRERYHTPYVQKSVSQPTTSQPSWQTPASLVQDSAPGNDATTAVFTTPTRVLEHYLQYFNESSQASYRTSQSIHTPRAKDVEFGKSDSAPRSSGQTNEGRDSPTIPCTPGHRPRPVPAVEPGKTSTGFQLDHALQIIGEASQDQLAEEEVIGDSMLQEPKTPPVIRADSEPPTSKRSRQDKAHNSPQSLLRTCSDVGPRRIDGGLGRNLTFHPQHGYGYASLDLRAPDPPVGCGQMTPEDLITLGLGDLASILKNPKRLQLEQKKRDLRPFERGYWSLDCSDWAPQLRREMWVFLANYIGMGEAGWGISCKRDEEFSWLRLYCWGAVVVHIYLLLYLASQRKILFTGAIWIDGEGEVVIVMGKRT